MESTTRHYCDISIITVTDDLVCMTASDSSAEMRNKVHDKVCVPPRIIAQMAVRVSLLELFRINICAVFLINLIHALPQIYQLRGPATSLLMVGTTQIAYHLQEKFSNFIRIGEFV
ncbi:hypothetical protein HZY91_03310 [Facklamia sp. DSM 111018]|uniref:Uncharacterized protein n=1 Tax=Facklamia lactis TaxID=2749967 RepID=A0ABS0LR25_9LACT|nr:hypothetical protein [Facklamia lactis]MBG9985920.1 hypothetical protein [Facklamia lactis]